MRRTRRNRKSRRGGMALVGIPYSQSDTSTWGNSNYYPYNETPRLFTESTYNDQQYIYRGGRRKRSRQRKRRRLIRGGGDSLNVWSQPLTNITRSLTYDVGSAVNTLRGHYPGVNPSVLSQPI